MDDLATLWRPDVWRLSGETSGCVLNLTAGPVFSPITWVTTRKGLKMVKFFCLFALFVCLFWRQVWSQTCYGAEAGSEQSILLLPSAGIPGICHHTWLYICFD